MCILTGNKLHLDEQRAFIDEVVVVRHDVGVVQHRQNIDFILRIFAFALAQTSQVHLLPHDQRVVLETTRFCVTSLVNTSRFVDAIHVSLIPV